MIIKQVQHFFESFKQYFFSFKDGFFIIPVFHNSPALIVDLFKKTPGVIFTAIEQKIFVSNKILTSATYYREFETNFWLLYSPVSYHLNTMYRFIYYKDIPVQHHLLVFYYLTQNINNTPLLSNNYSYNNYGWLFQKPKHAQSSCHFKNTSIKYINIYIPDIWIKEMLLKPNSIFTEDCKLRSYFNDDSKKFINLDSNDEDRANQIIMRTEMLLKKEITPCLNGEFKEHVEGLINEFTNTYNAKYKDQLAEVNLSDEARRKMLKAEQLITEHLFLKFPSIDYIAKEINYSATPLKTNFKLLYGESVFQYYRNKQLEYAKKVFAETNESVANVAATLAYENSNKFSLAFKKKYGILPSEVKKQQVE